MLCAEEHEQEIVCPSCGCVPPLHVSHDGDVRLYLHTYDGQAFFCDVCDPPAYSMTMH
jgi:hypothetical protein